MNQGYGLYWNNGTSIAASGTGLQFSTSNGVGNMVLMSNGNVGIGTGYPNAKFDISNGSDGVTMGPAINSDNNFTVQTYIDGQYANRVAYAGGCCNNLALQPDTGTVSIGGTSGNYGANKLNVIGNAYFSGNVGIGTTSPNANLSLGSTVGRKLYTYDNGDQKILQGLGVDMGGGPYP